MYDSQYHINPVMVARRRLTDQERHLAVARIRTGSTQCDVAGELGVSQSVISRLVHRFRDTGSVGERPRSGAPRGTTRNDDQYLRIYANGRRLQARARQPRDLPELRVAVVEEWNELSQNNFNRLVRSMRRHCQAVIDARGGNTRY